MPAGRELEYTPDQMIEALEASSGIIASAARRLMCSRTTVHAYINRFPEVKAALDEANETTKDEMEGRLIALCRAQNHRDHFSAIRYYLRSKARDRGFSESLDVTSGNEPITSITIVAPTDDSTSADE